MARSPDGRTGDRASSVHHLIVPYTRGVGVDIGCGEAANYPHFLSIDPGRGLRDGLLKGPRGVLFPIADIISDGQKLEMFADGGLSFVHCSNYLQTMDDPLAALAEWWRVIKPGGHLVLVAPNKTLVPNVGNPGADPLQKHDFGRQDIIDMMDGIRQKSAGWDMLEDDERGNIFFQVYRKRKDRKKTLYMAPSTDQKRALVVRYGAFGDQIIMSSVLPGLKKQDYHITVNCDARGYPVLKNDPHIDEFIVQDRGQVPNEDLGDYLEALSERYDRIVNLSESIEKSLLAMEGTTLWSLDYKARRNVVGKINYLERTHELADVPYEPAPKFYATTKEKNWAKKFSEKFPDGPLLLWVMMGSSVHKVWPYPQILLSWIMDHSNINIVTVGDDRAQAIEEDMIEIYLKAVLGEIGKNETINSVDEAHALMPIEFRRRIKPMSNRMSIRDTMALAEHGADIVLGPETGVLNAVSFSPVPKVMMLSHSSFENLSRDWVNTTTLAPNPAPECFPCHRLHFSDKDCPHVPETAAAACASAITPKTVFEALIMRLEREEAA